ncbi:MAG: Gfo/Idh/MocA family oxidoreductase [Drouetiella hepatica Uher 2000/2452]|jgi:predicted dehydrogenase|uniref:Gfo/Idh/MocA family oxidoreductase n=1 Tax=Drouetiella hepatica Uher 2000/2452 TaxID=904376 RepID=A0A951QDZ0_9CYAN|nr:Gfo/Idh/MocA family oxidoreductase [Drouetiella hepatica Uher 2000/2452]
MKVAVIGCGLIGKRRSQTAMEHPLSELAIVVDINPAAAEAVAAQYGCESATDWKAAIAHPDIDIVAVATHNGLLAEIAIAALQAGKHVLIEKPMGRNLAEALKMAEAAKAANRILKIGFNHRYHPALAKAYDLFQAGAIGEIINIRARYGHGGRPGYENEWRGNPELAGGGELTDQGVHIADLIHWFAGLPTEAFAYLQTAIWPIQPLEDNGFGLFRFGDGAIASFHTSWTQWKNLFSFEIYGQKGSLTIEGLGKSYGIERLTIAYRKPEGGVPDLEDLVFDLPDTSWELEWQDFIEAIAAKTPYWGAPEEGVSAMRMLDALYRSAKAGAPIHV